ncbi:MAG: hypothetical protein HC879_17010 [Leptolyngbyaceae cyanobacterium SL_5_9]|nr:hypothetical protein [Leptolyngbyaceae cyanobacterium SL_5_9]NJO75842.1 hypothetical protein [Leptolyngbyaceae cyanobacterium RM1_406_9]
MLLIFVIELYKQSIDYAEFLSWSIPIFKWVEYLCILKFLNSFFNPFTQGAVLSVEVLEYFWQMKVEILFKFLEGVGL